MSRETLTSYLLMFFFSSLVSMHKKTAILPTFETGVYYYCDGNFSVSLFTFVKRWTARSLCMFCSHLKNSSLLLLFFFRLCLNSF